MKKQKSPLKFILLVSIGDQKKRINILINSALVSVWVSIWKQKESSFLTSVALNDGRSLSAGDERILELGGFTTSCRLTLKMK